MRCNEKWHRMLFACNGNKLSDRILGNHTTGHFFQREMFLRLPYDVLIIIVLTCKGSIGSASSFL